MEDISESEEKFLIEEFKTAWSHLGLLDSRRYNIFQYFSAFVGVSIGAIIGAMKYLSGDHLLKYLACLGIFSLVSLTASISVAILISERKATERYRNKINKIRKIFLVNCKNQLLSESLRSDGFGCSLEIEECTTNNLSVFNLFSHDMRCTSLYISAYIQAIGMAAIIGLIVSLYKVLN